MKALGSHGSLDHFESVRDSDAGRWPSIAAVASTLRAMSRAAGLLLGREPAAHPGNSHRGGSGSSASGHRGFMGSTASRGSLGSSASGHRGGSLGSTAPGHRGGLGAGTSAAQGLGCANIDRSRRTRRLNRRRYMRRHTRRHTRRLLPREASGRLQPHISPTSLPPWLRASRTVRSTRPLQAGRAGAARGGGFPHRAASVEGNASPTL